MIAPGERLLFGLDDTPTKRYGPKVEGAGVHHNPTPGPADQKFLYGHVWVTLAWLVRHPLWGAIGLPLRAWLYVRRKDVGKLPRWYGVAFRTKLEMAAEAVAWLADWLKYLGKTLWVVADGAYAKRPFLKAAKAAGVVVVSRLRKDAALWSVPAPPRPGASKKRGRKPKYGKEKISLAKAVGTAMLAACASKRASRTLTSRANTAALRSPFDPVVSLGTPWCLVMLPPRVPDHGLSSRTTFRCPPAS